NWCSAQAPDRSSVVSAWASMRTWRAALRSIASSCPARAANCRQPQSPVSVSSSPSAVRWTSAAMYGSARLQSALGVQVRLEEPQILVDLARDAGEEIGAIG